ncbi:MAG: todS [Flavipsychrobacter sp.]|nr:todS [Flavipsychrobacter sp.]
MRRILLFLLFSTFSLSYAQEHSRLDSLLSRLSNDYRSRHDTAKVRLLYEIAYEYNRLAIDSVNCYGKAGLQLAEQLDDKYGQGMCHYLIGSGMSGYIGSMGDLMKALTIFEQLDDKKHIAIVLDDIAGHYYIMERYEQALTYFKRTLMYSKKIKDDYNAARAMLNMGETYGRMGDFYKELEYEFAVLPYFEKTSNYDKTGIARSDIGNAYLGLKDYNKALLYASSAVRVFRRLYKSDFRLAFALSDMGHIYFIAANDGSIAPHADSLLSASKKENITKAIYYYTEAHKVYEIDRQFVPTDIALRLSNALEAIGQYADALKYYKEYAALKDTLLSQDIRLKVSAAETWREAYLKEQQIVINKVQETGKKRERWLFGISLCLLGIVITLVWRNYDRQKQANEKLAGEKLKLEAANAHIAGEKKKSDDLAVDLQESLIQKDVLTEQLSHSAAMKTKFLANISHELRTPVTLLTGMLELMNYNDDAQNDKSKKRLEMAYSNSRKLLYMVEEILDLSRAERGELKANLEIKEIIPILKRMVYAFEVFIEKKQLTLAFTTQQREAVHISVDEHMLEKMVNNLMYNAIKFNVHGGWIKVHATLSANRKQFIFSVTNGGSRIKAADLPYIFDRFYQGHTSTAKPEGVGIGLNLVKELTTMMGGTVEAVSSEDIGTSITLQFPVVVTTVKKEDAVGEVTLLPSLVWEHFPERQTVLIVEDNEEMRYYLRDVLGENVNIGEARNGKEALEWLGKNIADLVITDLMMPEMPGEEFIGCLKKNEKFKKIPVITLTALADSGTRMDILRLGIDDYIVKPFSAMELRVRVYNLLHNLQERRQFETKPSEADDILVESEDAGIFRERVTAFVLGRIKIIDVSVYDLAYELSMSERQLYRVAKKLTGCTPAQLIREVKLQRAYELLISGIIYKIDDVARQVGYEDSNYFSRQFLERFGKRPSHFL